MTEVSGSKVIVIEGMGGAGKTTTAQILATQYGLSTFNTGTLFRAVAASMLYDHVGLADTADFVTEASFQIDTADALRPHVAVNGLDVSDNLQLPEVTSISSIIGQVEPAASKLEGIFQRRLNRGNMVVEGKHLADRVGAIATDMFFFMARPEVRAWRKWNQALEKGRGDYTLQQANQDTLLNDMRDKNLLSGPANTTIMDTSDIPAKRVARLVAEQANLI